MATGCAISDNDGQYWSATGHHFYVRDANDFYLRSGSSSNIGLAMANNAGTIYGYHYADASGTGILTNARGWGLRVDNSGHAYITGYGFAQYFNSTDNVVSSGVTGVMVKQGDSYHRTADVTALWGFLGGTGGTILNQYASAQSANMWISGEVKVNSWLRTVGGATGLYNESYGNHFYADGSLWNFGYGGSGGARFRNGYGGGVYGYTYGDANGAGILSGSGNWAVRSTNAENSNNSDVSFFTDGGSRRAYINSAGLYWDLGNPYINASSYFISPGGAYFNGGTVYFEAATQHRAGISNDGGYAGGDVQVNENLRISGVVPCIDGDCPSNNAIRMTPNFHLNSPAGAAVILNWDNGSSGASQVLRTTGDGFNVYADGQVFCTNWFRPTGASGLYFQSYGGGWHMSDGTWIRSYGGRQVYVDSQLRADGGLVSGGIGTSGAGYIDASRNIITVGGSQGTLALTSDLPGYSINTYPTVLTSGAYMYLSVGGNYSAYISGGGAYTAVSSRSKKENFEELDKQDILNRISELEMYKWNYKVEDQNVKHIGPIAEDFWDKFRLNDNECMVSHVDPAGVALVGVQALNENYNSQQKQIETLQANLSDFGSVNVASKSLWVNFSSSFTTAIDKNKLPVVTVTSNKPGVVIYIAEKNSTGFRLVVDSELPEGLFIDYVAMAHAQPVVPAEVKPSAQSIALSKVMPHHNQNMAAFADPDNLTGKAEKAKQEAIINALPYIDPTIKDPNFVGPEKSGVHDPKANDVDALIEKSKTETQPAEMDKNAPTQEMWQDEKYKYQPDKVEKLQVDPGSTDKSNAPK